MPPRSIWSGVISFGLVNIPVRAHSAVREHTVHFHQLDDSGARVRYQKVSERTGKAVERTQLGYETDGGDYVTFDPDELARLRPVSSKSVDVNDFVDLAQIDPVYYDATYWLAPDGDAAQRAYVLLAAAMQEQQKVEIGTVVMRNKEHLAAIRPMDGALAMSTMHFADEVVRRDSVAGIPAARVKAAPKEMKLAEQIIDSLSGEWEPERYHDAYTEMLRDLIARKGRGEEIPAAAEAEPEGRVLDLVAALQASVDAARDQRDEDGAGARPKRPRKATGKARKSA